MPLDLVSIEIFEADEVFLPYGEENWNNLEPNEITKNGTGSNLRNSNATNQ